MTTIKLNRYYPHLTENITLEVSDEIAVVLSTGGRQCDSYKRRKREHNECSLDVDPGFELDVMFPPLTPESVRPLHSGQEKIRDCQGRKCGGKLHLRQYPPGLKKSL
jgi:hypothetical protein